MQINYEKLASHPIDNPSGKWFYRKVGVAEGFAHDCALILNNAKILSKTRIISISGTITGNLSDNNNVFREIRKTMLRNFFSKEWIEHQKLVQSYEQEKEKNRTLLEDYEKLLEENKILKSTKNEINYLTKKEISYIIITGGLTEIKDFNILAESVFGKNVTIGSVNTIGARDNKYSTAIGMIKNFNDKLNSKDKDYSIFNEDEIEILCSSDKRISVASDSILGKVFGYFFDN